MHTILSAIFHGTYRQHSSVNFDRFQVGQYPETNTSWVTWPCLWRNQDQFYTT